MKGSNIEVLSSISNPKLRRVRELLDRSRARKKEDAFVVEGIRMFREIPEDRLMETFISEKFHEENPSIRGSVVKNEVFQKLSDTRTPQGVLAVVRQRHYTLPDILQGENGLWLILEGIQDPGNLGTMIRTGEGAGISGIIMDRNTADFYSPKTVRSTMGAVFRVPFFYTEDLAGTVREIKKTGITTYAAHLDGKKMYHEIDYADRTAFLIGNEGNGLSDELTSLADIKLRIPMQGQVESLNAAISAALLMYRYMTGR